MGSSSSSPLLEGSDRSFKPICEIIELQTDSSNSESRKVSSNSSCLDTYDDVFEPIPDQAPKCIILSTEHSKSIHAK